MGCLVQNQRTLLLAIVAIILIFEETRANQLEIAKKYGKRFGNKAKSNNSTTDAKDIEKMTTKAASDITTTITRPTATDLTETPAITRQQRYSSTRTTSATLSTTTPMPTTTVEVRTEESDEVDVDLSQLQVSLPNVKFDCGSRAEGYYGDPDYRCEVFHYCSTSGKRETFLCPSNSKFNQNDMTCDTDAQEDLCPPEPAWGQNHMYPTQSPTTLSHVSPIEFNKNINKDKPQIEVTAPKFETKENGFREPVYDIKSRDEPKRTQTNTTPMNINNNNYGNEGNTNTNNNNYSNNKLKDNYNNNNKDNNNNNKEIKSNHFGATFGERQRTNGALDSSATVGSAGPNDHNSRKNSQMNANNNNNNYNYKTHHLSSDFGTVSDANKKGYNKEENGNTNPRQPPMVVTLSTTTDSEHYRSKQQSFTPNSYPFNKPVIQSSDFNSVRNNNNNNNRITYESSQSEQYVPSTAPDKSYLLPPPLTTDMPSSSPASPHKSYTSVRHSQPVHTLAPSVSSRQVVKWPKKQSPVLDAYVTDRNVRHEITTTAHPPPPLAPPAPPIRQYKQPKEEFAQMPIEAPVDVWPENDQNTQGHNYENSKNMPVHHQQAPTSSAPPPKHIQSEQLEITHPRWSPVGQTVHTFMRDNNHNSRPNIRHPTKVPHKTWGKIEAQHHQQQQDQHQRHQQHQQQLQQQFPQQEADPYLQNNDKPYSYPAVHHTIAQSGPADNHLWSTDDRTTQQQEVDYRNKNRNNFQSQSIAPLKPKWAQEMSEMDQMQTMQAMTELAQPVMPPMQEPKWPSMRTGHKNKNHSPKRQPIKISESDIFGTQNPLSQQQLSQQQLSQQQLGQQLGQQLAGSLIDISALDYSYMKPTTSRPQSKSPMNMFYDQFKTYSFAENSPTEYVHKMTETEKQLIKQNEEQNKENIKSLLKMRPKAQNISPTMEPLFSETPSLKDTLITQMKQETLIDQLRKENEQLKKENNQYIPSSPEKESGYVPDMLPGFLTEEEYASMSMPETHLIPKLHKPKQKAKTAKHHPNRYSPSKQFMTSNILDELLTAENNWSLKNMDTSALEAAFSHNYPVMPISYPTPRPKAKMPKIPKTSYATSIVSHMAAPTVNRPNFILGAPLPPRPMQNPTHMPQHMHQSMPQHMHQPMPQPMAQPQPSFFIPQPMPFPAQLPAQQAMPFQFYMPTYFPTAQQSMRSTVVVKPPKNTPKQSKSKSVSPKLFKF